MKLFVIIKYMKGFVSAEDLFDALNLDIDSEFVWSIYVKGEIELNSEVEILSEEEADGQLVIEKNGIKYIEFFALTHLWDLLNNEFADYPNDETLANRLMHYRKYDA
jgi:hypothetical protein